MEKEKGKGRHDIYGSSNRKDITGRQLREIDEWRRNRGGTISECILRNFFPSRLIFLILWLIPPRWVHRSEVHRSPTTWRTTIRTAIPDPPPHSFFSPFHPHFFPSPSIVSFLPLFPPIPYPCCCCCRCPRKCIKGAAAFNLGGCAGNATSDPDLE